MPERKSLPAAEAIKSFAKVDITVMDVKTDRAGKPVRNPDTNQLVTVAMPLAAGNIHAASEDGETVFITTVDGRKYSAPKVTSK